MSQENESALKQELDYKSARLEYLKSRLTSRIRFAKLYSYMAVFIVIIGAVVIAASLFGESLLYDSYIADKYFVLFLFVYAVLVFMLSLGVKHDVTMIDQEIKELEFEIDLQKFERSLLESKAEKTLRVNDIQLQKYYNLNLNHNSWVFKVGVGCLALGVILIVITLYVVINYVDKLETQFIVATLGAVSTFLTSYVAAIFLKIQASASQHLGSFHSRLVDTHQILLASLVASRIEDSSLREKTLSDLVLKVISRKVEDD